MLRIAIKHRDLYLGKVCTIEWKRSLCSKTLQNRLYEGTLKYKIFLSNVCGQPISH